MQLHIYTAEQHMQLLPSVEHDARAVESASTMMDSKQAEFDSHSMARQRYTCLAPEAFQYRIDASAAIPAMKYICSYAHLWRGQQTIAHPRCPMYDN